MKKRMLIMMGLVLIFLVSCNSNGDTDNQKTGTIDTVVVCLAPEGAFKPCPNVKLSDGTIEQAFCGKYVDCNDLEVGQTIVITRASEKAVWDVASIKK